MEKKIARVTWSKGRYSDVYRTFIVDASPLKLGQSVKVLWGKSRKEYTAVLASYPLDETREIPVSQEEPAPRRARAKRKLVSIYFSSKQL